MYILAFYLKMRQWKYTALFLATALITVWASTTQPIFPVDQKEVGMSVDPLHLRQHVETIAGSFYPCDEGHPENLMQIAAYIQDVLSETGADIPL